MILFINTSQTDLIQVKLIKGDKIINQSENREEYRQSELLLKMINELFSKGYTIHNTRFVAVVSGPGAFSALRIGISTANSLAWSLKVPVVEVSVNEAESDEKLIKVLKEKTTRLAKTTCLASRRAAERERLKDYKTGDFKPVVPKYGKEPNITSAKT